MAPRISVLIPIYKVEKYLMQCIDSVLNQTFRDIEVLLIDEGDNDPCYAVMLYYEQKDPRVRLFHQKSGGYGASINIGLRAARGEYISIIESDDFIDQDMFQDMYAAASASSADIVKTPFWEFYDSLDGKNNLRFEYQYTGLLNAKLSSGVFRISDLPYLMAVHPSIWSSLYRTELLRSKQIEFIEARGAGYVDVVFRVQVLAEAERVLWLPKAYYNYRNTNPGSSVNNFSMKTMIKRWNEVHQYLNRRNDNLTDAIYPYLILEEYVCTYARLFGKDTRSSILKSDFDLLKINLSHVPHSAINSSPVLGANHLQHLALLRQADSLQELAADASPGMNPEPVDHTHAPSNFEHIIKDTLPFVDLFGDGVWRDIVYDFVVPMDVREAEFAILIIVDAGAHCSLRLALLCEENSSKIEALDRQHVANIDAHVAERWFSVERGVNYLLVSTEMMVTLRGFPDMSRVRRVLLGGTNSNLRARAAVGMVVGKAFSVLAAFTE